MKVTITAQKTTRSNHKKGFMTRRHLTNKQLRKLKELGAREICKGNTVILELEDKNLTDLVLDYLKEMSGL